LQFKLQGGSGLDINAAIGLSSEVWSRLVRGGSPESSMEQTGKEMDKAAEKADRQIDKAVKKTGEKIEKTGGKIKDSVK
jgi:hypothetical protein